MSISRNLLSWPFLAAFLLVAFVSCDKNEKEFFADEELETLMLNNPDGINFYFLGDGYVKRDLEKSGGQYRQDAVQYMEFLFEKAPFSEFQDQINFHVIYVESAENLSNRPDNGGRDTAFNLEFRDGVLYNFDLDKMIALVQIHFPDFDLFEERDVILLSLKGGSVAIGGGGIALFPNTSFGLMLHEVGHAFAGLGDEYESLPGVDYDPSYTYANANLDSTGNPELIKWRHFFGVKGYESTGIFEGGGYLSEGIWRPDQNSVMRYAGDGKEKNFNAPSREAIVRKIMTLSGTEYSFEAFLNIDRAFIVSEGEAAGKRVSPVEPTGVHEDHNQRLLELINVRAQ